MSDRLHITMPCSRPANIPLIARALLQDMDPHPFELRWHILVQGEEPDPNGLLKVDEAIGDIAQNDVHMDWIWAPSDDSIHHPSLFKRLAEVISQNLNARAIVFSEQRGNGDPNCPWTGHPWPEGSDRILHATPENMKVCRVDGSQVFLERDFIGNARFCNNPPIHCADGAFIEKLYVETPEAFVFVPETLIRFNSLQW
ncbi:MAG TPA: hypothetical protein VF077_12865 [Nitrospiraceae bacterium]